MPDANKEHTLSQVSRLFTGIMLVHLFHVYKEFVRHCGIATNTIIFFGFMSKFYGKVLCVSMKVKTLLYTI